jgi:dienelactone hydrolase
MEQLSTPNGFLSLLGELPQESPPDSRILSKEALETYTRLLIEYSIGDEQVQAYLLVPKGVTRQQPGVLAIHQDGEHRPYEYGGSEPAGVAGDPGLQYGLELCLRGYVVICPDRFPFASRSLAKSKYKETFGRYRVFTPYQGQSFELTEDLYRGCVANRLLFEGRTLLGRELYELQRVLDHLSSLPEVDGDRLGVIGHSAGGLLGALLMYIDPRVKVGCASSGTFLVRWIYGQDNLKPITGFGSALAVPSLKQWGDIDDVLAGLAPRPFLETHGDFTQEMVDEKSRKARQRYAELGVPERYQSLVYDAKAHVFRQDMREKSYEWFDRWLKGDLLTADRGG